jgi:hypothetical protein
MGRRNWMIFGVVAAVLALVFCAAVIVVGAAWLGRETPEKVVDTYLTALQHHDRAKADSVACEGMRRGMAGKLAGLAQEWSDIVDWEIIDVDRRSKSADVDARITYKVVGLATTNRFTLTLIKEGDDWKVCGFRMDGTPSGVTNNVANSVTTG